MKKDKSNTLILINDDELIKSTKKFIKRYEKELIALADK
jgi:hypothetical protein